MGKSHWLNRLADAVLMPPVRWVGERVEARLRRAAPDLPEPPVWAGPVGAVGVVGAVIGHVVRSASERATTEPKATEERGTTSERDEGGQDDAEEIVEALETLDVEFPPAPSQEEVKAAYRERAVETHPDQGGDAERFIEVQEAWERLPEREELSDGGQEEK
jgi:hypothetical protein